jgi:60 kDa SS-A/Ro ribonucleoprotein
MASLNRPIRLPQRYTHEGGKAQKITPYQELRRSVLTALLWEDTFYEKGSSIAQRVKELVPQISGFKVAELAWEARNKMYLRHVPLFLIRELARTVENGTLVADTLAECIQRPDELTEYLAMYWREAKTDKDKEPLSAGSKKGLARAFKKFDEYSLAKYDRDGAYKLRDVIRLVHPKPYNAEQSELFKKVIDRTLTTPDTWEVALSGGANKKDAFERLLAEKKLGGLAFLRNLRNMTEANVRKDLIRERFKGEFRKVLPFRFLAAARYAPGFADELSTAMLGAAQTLPKLKGHTAVVVDVSGSMQSPISSKSDLRRIDAANGVAILAREVAESCRVFTFSDNTVEVSNVRGIPLADAIWNSQRNSGTYLSKALREIYRENDTFNRIIVVTDEQSADHSMEPVPEGVKGYIINVAPYKNGVEHKNWIHIDGFSERVLDFVQSQEEEDTTW